MNAKKLAQYYHKNGVKKTAAYFGVTAKTIYKNLHKYSIETIKAKYEREWYDNVNVLNLKWAKQKYRNWWGCGD